MVKANRLNIPTSEFWKVVNQWCANIERWDQVKTVSCEQTFPEYAAGVILCCPDIEPFADGATHHLRAQVRA